MSTQKTIYIASRGSALALVQANFILRCCRENFPQRSFDLKIIKTTGDKLQTASMTNPGQQLEKGLFTKELEVALLDGEATLAVHSLKDLPTDLPEGLILGATSEREDVRDVLIYRGKTIDSARGLASGATLRDFAPNSTIATSSTRRQAQLLAIRSDLITVPIRGNVGTRLKKLAAREELDGIVLALAGLKRLGFRIAADGTLEGNEVPPGLLAVPLPLEQMLPCVGQAALGIEIPAADPVAREICASLNHSETFHCVTAERSFLRAMGGGCLSPVAALARVEGANLRLKAVSFRDDQFRKTELTAPLAEAVQLGQKAARELL
jgi:hydroxymethylbilane synthase